MSAAQWCSVLAIATKYDMEIIRRKAIEELKLANPPLDPVDQIVAARRYHCVELVEQPLAVLVKRREPLSFEEMSKLAPEDLHEWITTRDATRPCRGNSGIRYFCNQCGGSH